MKTVIAGIVLSAIGLFISFQASAGTNCSTTCIGNTCYTHCY